MTSAFLVLGLLTADGLHAVATDGASLTDLGPALVVPGATGWTRVALVSAGEEVRWLVAAPAGQPFAPTLPPVDRGCEESSVVAPTFVSAALTTVADVRGGYCGGAHPWAFTARVPLPLSAWVRPPVAPATLPEVPPVALPEATRAALAAAAQASLVRADEDEQSCFHEHAAEPEWDLVHHEGAWTIEGFIPYGYEACRGLEWAFDTDLTPPPELAPPRGPVIARPADAQDWVTVPGVDWRVDIRDTGLVLVGPTGERARLALPQARVVQADWATGKAAARWAVEAVAAAVDPGIGEPRVRVVTRRPGGQLDTFDAGPRGLAWVGGGARVRGLLIDVARAGYGWEVVRGDRALEEGLELALSTGTAAPRAFPSPPAEPVPGATGHAVTVLAIDDQGVTYRVQAAPPAGEDDAVAPPRVAVRTVPLFPAAYSYDALYTAGSAGRAAAFPRMGRAVGGAVEVRCTDAGLEVRSDGALVSRLDLPRYADMGDPVPGGQPACTIVATEDR